jgi:hypothetical protein
VSSVRSVTQTIGSWFDENEMAQVMRAMKALDMDFTREGFERDLREYIVPEVVDAYLTADRDALKEWCGEAVGRSARSSMLREIILFPPPSYRRITCYGQRWNNICAKVSSATAKSSTYGK